MKRIVGFLLAGAILFAMAGCSNGVPQEDYDKVVTELDVLEKELQEKNAEISSLYSNAANIFPGSIQFDKNTKVYAFLVKNDENTIGIVFCDFDGTNLEREAVIAVGCLTALYALNVDDVAAYDFNGNIIATAPNGDIHLKQKYIDFDIFNESVLEKYKEELTIILNTII